ncbi:glycosyltransferase family 2 protein [Mucilaginibacter straminoryzae]|uniref:glycosyltransferase family 2 protein n=1 Tax=Mucilaginibacter straminoryzae TaxID=2932774 RepID=UPI0021D47FC9|nr:glycosyltransferase family 2 protein [Mucilaginibacter straminoryzae]
MQVSVIIVNYNTCSMTIECIESIVRFTKNIYEIIVVDNASTDQSKEMFSSDSRIKYIYLDENIGFGGANNLGIAVAKGKYIFLLNPDTILLYDIIEKLYLFAEDHRDHKIGAIGTCLINNYKADMMSFGEFISAKRIYKRLFEKLPTAKRSYEADIYQILNANYYAKVDFVSGADLFIPRKVLDQVSVFDPGFFMYYEETDLQKRMHDLGYSNYVINERGIIHLEGGSFDSIMKFERKLIITQSLNLYIKKHLFGLKKFHLLLLSFLVLIKDLLKSRYSLNHNIILLKALLK